MTTDTESLPTFAILQMAVAGADAAQARVMGAFAAHYLAATLNGADMDKAKAARADFGEVCAASWRDKAAATVLRLIEKRGNVFTLDMISDPAAEAERLAREVSEAAAEAGGYTPLFYRAKGEFTPEEKRATAMLRGEVDRLRDAASVMRRLAEAAEGDAVRMIGAHLAEAVKAAEGAETALATVHLDNSQRMNLAAMKGATARAKSAADVAEGRAEAWRSGAKEAGGMIGDAAAAAEALAEGAAANADAAAEAGRRAKVLDYAQKTLRTVADWEAVAAAITAKAAELKAAAEAAANAANAA